MATLVQQEGTQGYLQAQPEVFNQSDHDSFNFSEFVEQVNFLEQNKNEMMANPMIYRNENSEQGGNLENNEWSYKIRVNDSFNAGNHDQSYHEHQEHIGYNHDLSGYNPDSAEYNLDTSGYNYDTGYNGVVYNLESHGLYEADAENWSPHSKFSRRQSHGIQTLQDIINTSKAEDIPDFPSLSKGSTESRLPQAEKTCASGWNAQRKPHASNPVQLCTNSGQVESNPQISFQWLENEFANVVGMPKEVTALPTMNQVHTEGRKENLQDSEQFQLPMFTPPEPKDFSQSVANWNCRKVRATS